MPRCCCVMWASASIEAAWLLHRTYYCVFLLHRRETHSVASPCGHRCMACSTVCLTVMLSFSDITIGHSFKPDRSRTPLSHRAEGDDVIGRELNLDEN